MERSYFSYQIDSYFGATIEQQMQTSLHLEKEQKKLDLQSIL